MCKNKSQTNVSKKERIIKKSTFHIFLNFFLLSTSLLAMEPEELKIETRTIKMRDNDGTYVESSDFSENIIINRSKKDIITNVEFTITDNEGKIKTAVVKDPIRPGEKVVYSNKNGHLNAKKIEHTLFIKTPEGTEIKELPPLSSIKAGILRSTFMYEGMHQLNLYRESPVNRINLSSLECVQTEDLAGRDECKLDIYADGAHTSYRKRMNNGQTWALDIPINFRRRVVVKLTDLDNPGFPWYDDHDRLGSITIRPTQPEGSATFDEDGAEYILNWEKMGQ